MGPCKGGYPCPQSDFQSLVCCYFGSFLCRCWNFNKTSIARCLVERTTLPNINRFTRHQSLDLLLKEQLYQRETVYFRSHQTGWQFVKMSRGSRLLQAPLFLSMEQGLISLWTRTSSWMWRKVEHPRRTLLSLRKWSLSQRISSRAMKP